MWAKLRSLFTKTRDGKPEAALESAQQDLKQAIRQDPEVRQVVAELKYHREVNHFAERIKASMRGT